MGHGGPGPRPGHWHGTADLAPPFRRVSPPRRLDPGALHDRGNAALDARPADPPNRDACVRRDCLDLDRTWIGSPDRSRGWRGAGDNGAATAVGITITPSGCCWAPGGDGLRCRWGADGHSAHAC